MKYHLKNPFLLYAPETDAGASDSETQDDAPATDVVTFDTWLAGQDAAVRSLITGHIAGLKNALKAERKRAKTLESQMQTVTPPEGSITLTPEQAQAWTAYQQLGEPADLATLKGEHQALQRKALIAQAAQVAGYKDSVLATLVGDLSLEVREAEVDGKKVAAAYIKGADGKETSLPDYAAAHWADFMPALQQEATGSRQQGQTFVRQQAGTRPAPANQVQATLEKKYGRPGKTAAREK